MLVTILAAATGLAGIAAGSPIIVKRAPNDAQILNYALTLEHLEDTFYRQGLANFSADDFADAGFAPGVRLNIETIAADEAEHVSFLTGALSSVGANPVAECTYGFGVTDVHSFVMTASLLEGVGVSAYLGAAADIMNKNYLTAAGSILTVEARHSSYIRSTLHQSPFPQPFDAPLTYDQVYSLAAQFILSCPSTNELPPLTAFPKLQATSCDKTIMAGSKLTLATPGTELSYNGSLYAAFITVLGPIFVPVASTDGKWEVEVPKGVNGQSYVVLTSSSDTLTDDTTLAGPAVIEIEN